MSDNLKKRKKWTVLLSGVLARPTTYVPRCMRRLPALVPVIAPSVTICGAYNRCWVMLSLARVFTFPYAHEWSKHVVECEQTGRTKRRTGIVRSSWAKGAGKNGARQDGIGSNGNFALRHVCCAGRTPSDERRSAYTIHHSWGASDHVCHQKQGKQTSKQARRACL